ncbi:MAG: CPBP family intramembrane metalloprotease [Planctomycetes bacterium]|nr:CPBP family intramembrane metalloprotease [Planctomycetota bacterium]MBL7009139.1 CPBP family intramembrane metalloprotease [Planctomycetota bacterium]
MRRCAYCGGPLVDSARFCPACGMELPAYVELFRDARRPRPIGFLDRVPIQGKPATRMVVAILASLFMSAGFLGLFHDTGDWMVFADLVMASAIVACAWPERRELRPLWRLPNPGWLLLAVAGALVLPQLAHLYVGLLPEELAGGEDPFAGMSAPVKAFSFCLMPGVFEELAFRGVVLMTLLHMLSFRRAHLLTAALFAGIHFSPIIFPYHLLVGVYLGWLRHRSGGLWAPILAHAVHNAAVVFLTPT